MKRSLAMLALIGVALPAHALVVGECEVTATPLPFGDYTPTNGSALQSTGTLTVSCQLIGLLQSWTIQLSAGNGSYGSRRMRNGSHNLNYNIYRDAARSEVWGNGTGGSLSRTDSVTLFVGLYSKNYTLYGQVPALQDVAPGSYNDTIMVTVNY